MLLVMGSVGAIGGEICRRANAHLRMGKANNWVWQETYAAAVVEILQSIRQSDMTPLLSKIFQSDGGAELLDVLMKYL